MFLIILHFNSLEFYFILLVLFSLIQNSVQNFLKAISEQLQISKQYLLFSFFKCQTRIAIKFWIFNAPILAEVGDVVFRKLNK